VSNFIHLFIFLFYYFAKILLILQNKLSIKINIQFKLKTMKKITILKVMITSLMLLMMQFRSNSQTFTAGNLAVFQVAASTTNTTGSILEISPNTAGQTAAVNTYNILGTGATALRFSGSAATTCFMSTSNNGSLLCFTGADTTATTGNVTTMLHRGVGTLDNSFNFSMATSYRGTNGTLTRCATTIDNVNYYIADQGGFYTNGSTTASPTGNIRSVKSFGGTVYAFTTLTTTPSVGIISAITGGTLTALPGLPNGTAYNSDFYLISSGTNGTTYDILYMIAATSATAGTIYKYSLVSGSWVANSSFPTPFGGYGICAAKNGSGADIYVTTGIGATINNSVVKLTDTTGYNSILNITTADDVTLYTATGSTILKGIAFAPVSSSAPNVPIVSTGTTTNISTTLATCAGNIISNGGATILQRGICYSTTALPDTSKSKVIVTGTSGQYSANLTGLTINTTYHYRAYAYNSVGISYGADSTFTTFSSLSTVITGSTTVCKGQNAVTYSVPVIANAISYSWTLPTGATGSSDSNSIIVNFSSSAVSGNISFIGYNSTGDPITATLAITVNATPMAPTATTPVTYCQYNTASELTATGTNLLWYATATSGTGSTNIPTPTTVVAGSTNYYVSQTINGCESPRADITVNINPVYNTNSNKSICQGGHIVVGTHTYTTAGTYTDTLSTKLGCDSIIITNLTVVQLPSSAGTITGAITVCQGQSAVLYNLPLITNATTYIWTLPNGATGTSDSNSIKVNYSNTSTSGNISVYGMNSCGNSNTSTLAITVNTLPANAGTISGTTTFCKGLQVATYTVPLITEATSYIWTLPTGITGTSSSNSITVNISSSAVSSNISVAGNNTCGIGVNSVLHININPTYNVNSNKTICQGGSIVVGTHTYTTAGTYNDTLLTTLGCDSIITTNLTVEQLPSAAGTITGAITVCQGQSAVIYNLPLITNATTYIWTLPNGATGTSDSNNIKVNYSNTSTSSNIKVYGMNSCGNSDTSILYVTVNTLPANAGTISGTTAFCKGLQVATYSVPLITEATSYIWTLPTGVTGTSSSNSITVNISSSAVSSNIYVEGNNACGNGVNSVLHITINPTYNISSNKTICQGGSIVVGTHTYTTAGTYNDTLSTTLGCDSIITTNLTVNPLPISAGIMSGDTIVCQGQDAVIYTVPSIANATSYNWLLPTGAIGSSNTNSITINYSLTAGSGNIKVFGTNTCGNSDTLARAVTVNQKPATPIVTQTANTLNSSAASGNQWYNAASGIISSATTQTYNPTANGYYYVIVTLNGCSSDSSNHYHYSTVGIDENENNKNNKNNKTINVYPNPISDILNIEIIGNNDILYFEVYNLIGQVIYKGNVIEKTTVQTSGFAPGVYIIKLDNGKSLEFKKIIKE